MGSVELLNWAKNNHTSIIMGSKPKTPKAAPVAAPARQSSLDIKRTQEDEKKRMRRRFGFQQSIYAGDNSGPLG